MWGVKSAVWSVKCEGSSGKWKVWSVECEVWSVKFQFGVRRAQCEVRSVRFGVWRKQWEVWSVECEVWSAKSAVWSVECEDFASSLAEKIKRLSREGHGRDRVSLNYRSFMFGKLPPPACPGLCYKLYTNNHQASLWTMRFYHEKWRLAAEPLFFCASKVSRGLMNEKNAKTAKTVRFTKQHKDRSLFSECRYSSNLFTKPYAITYQHLYHNHHHHHCKPFKYTCNMTSSFTVPMEVLYSRVVSSVHWINPFQNDPSLALGCLKRFPIAFL